jgi:D-alanyl-D-alanine carboxypeptidase
MNRITARMAACALATALPLGAPLASARTSDPSLDAIVDGFVEGRMGGASVLVTRGGIESTATAGVATAAGDPVTPTTRFRVGSISKVFVAVMVLQLVDEGRVDLDELLATYLPDSAVGGDVPVRLLLRHRSGLADYAFDEEFVLATFERLDRVFTPDELLGYIADDPVATPDTEFVYANTNYVLLGQLIERVEGSDLDSVLRARITGPLGLASTSFAAGGVPAPDGVAGPWYPDLYDGDPAAPYDSTASGTWAAGALISSPGDLAAFLGALFNGDLLTTASLAEMIDPGVDGGYGLGIEILGVPSGRTMYGHRGEVLGFLSLAAIEPTRARRTPIRRQDGTRGPVGRYRC